LLLSGRRAVGHRGRGGHHDRTSGCNVVVKLLAARPARAAPTSAPSSITPAAASPIYRVSRWPSWSPTWTI